MKKFLILLFTLPALWTAARDSDIPARAELIDLGFLCLQKKNFDTFELQRMNRDWGKKRDELLNGPADKALREIEGMERFQMRLAGMVSGFSLSPNFYPWEREKRIVRLKKEIKNRIQDWRNNADALKRFGLNASPEAEISRMTEFEEKYPGTTLTWSPEFDAAVSFFKEIAEERLRLGASILEFERELDGLQKALALRNSLGGEINAAHYPGRIRELLKQGRNAYNRRAYSVCAKREREVVSNWKDLQRKVYAEDGKTPVVRPGVSFRSTGVFGYSGTWHTLLCTNARGSTLFTDGDKEFRPYSDYRFQWEVSFDATGCVNTGFQQGRGSWTHAERTLQFQNLKNKKTYRADVFWSALAPGVLYRFSAPSVTISENTLRTPSAPAGIACEVNGSVRFYRDPSKIPLRNLSAKWFLLVWNNKAPKHPLLIVLEKTPAKIASTETGLVLEHENEIGLIAAGTLYGAVPQPAGYAADWETVPEKEEKQCRLLARLLSWFPLETEEFFAIEKEEVRIWNRVVKFIALDPSAKPYCPLPPAYSLALAAKGPLKMESELSAPVLATKFGFFRYAEGFELRYSTSAPDLLQRFPLRPLQGEEALLDEYNQWLMVRSKNNEWLKTHVGDQSLGLFAGWNMMNPETRKKLDRHQGPGERDRIASGESFYYRTRPNSAWLIPIFLIDPASGKSGWYAGWRGYRHGFPMKGDMTAFNMTLLQMPLAEALFYGRWDLVERHWERLKEFFSASELNQPWRLPGMNCTSSGLIITGDMYGDGFRSYSIMYRLALGMKDADYAARAQYLAAKQMLTTVACLHRSTAVYAAHTRNTGGPEKAEGHLGWSIGMDNNGARSEPWAPSDPSAWNAPFQNAGCTSYDYPFFGMLLRYLPEETAFWINDFRKNIPEWSDWKYCASKGERVYNAHNTLKYLAMSTADREKLRKIYQTKMHGNYSPRNPPYPDFPKELWQKKQGPFEFADFPIRANMLPYLIAQNDPVWIGDFGRMRLMHGTFDRETGTASIGVAAGEDDVLTVVSMIPPASVTVNGKKTGFRKGAWGFDYRIPVKAGAAEVLFRVNPIAPEKYAFPKRRPLTPLLTLTKAEPPALLGEYKPQRKNLKAGKCTPVDLSPYLNHAGDDQPPQTANRDVWKFPKGLDTVRGIPFRFAEPDKKTGNALIMLRGRQYPTLPKSVRVRIDRNCRRLFILHGLCFSKGRKAATYRLKFQDGQVRDLPVFNGIHSGEWKIPPDGILPADLPAALAGTFYPAAKDGQWGRGAGGFLMIWENNVRAAGITMQGADQQGLAKLQEIEFISEGESVPLILAVTVEE